MWNWYLIIPNQFLTNLSVNSVKIVCPDLDQRPTIGFLAEMIPTSTKMEGRKISKCLQWMFMDGLENHEQLICINHDFVPKSQMNPLPEF